MAPSIVLTMTECRIPKAPSKRIAIASKQETVVTLLKRKQAVGGVVFGPSPSVLEQTSTLQSSDQIGWLI